MKWNATRSVLNASSPFSSTMEYAEETPINFRILPAYRKHRRAAAAAALRETVVGDDYSGTLSQDGGQLLPPEVEIVSRKGTSSSSSSTLASLTTHPVPQVRRLNRKRKCIELCQRVAAFLLSTVGLTMLTVTYAVAGGYLFSALESQNVHTVKTGVSKALRWHISELWNRTAHLNVLHPVRSLLS